MVAFSLVGLQAAFQALRGPIGDNSAMRSIVAALTVILSHSARADSELEKTAEPLSLPQLFQVATRSAPELENAAFSLQQAEAQLTASQGSHDLVVSGIADYQRTRGAPTPGLGGSKFDVLQGSLSVKKLLPTNGTLELVGETVDSQNDILAQQSETITTGLKLRLTQPLLKGIGAASANRTFDIARHRRSAAVVRHSAEARSYAVAVVRAYWQLALAWKTLEVRRASLELGKKQVALVEAGIRTGKYAPAELLPVQVAITTRSQDILTAELDVVEESVALRRLVGLEVTPQTIAVKTVPLPDLDPETLDAKTLVAQAIQESDDLKAAIEDQRSAEAAALGSRRDLMPRADLRLEGGPIGSDVSIRDATTMMLTHSPSFGGSVRQIDAGGYALGANLTVAWDVGSHAVKGAYAADASTALNFKFLVGKARADIAADVTKTVFGARAHFESAQLGTKAIALGEANVEAETKKFENGKSSSSEIIRKQDELENARLRQAVEATAYLIALAQLDAASGAILPKYGFKILDR